MNFLSTILLFLFQARTPNNANTAPVEDSCVWCLPWWGTTLIIVGVVVIGYVLVKKLGWHLPGQGKGTGSGNVYKSDLPK
jgi:hypothetical protein